MSITEECQMPSLSKKRMRLPPSLTASVCQSRIRSKWNLLMEEQYGDLRSCIFDSVEEKYRFRQVIVKTVIATDTADKEVQTLRKALWNKAFYEEEIDLMRTKLGEDTSCKATVVFESIIQSSDVAHTMQHWHVYNKWNERSFKERYLAFLAGREETDPSLSWYDGEIGLWLVGCGVFGVSSDEYLNYALENRHEWGRKGRQRANGDEIDLQMNERLHIEGKSNVLNTIK